MLWPILYVVVPYGCAPSREGSSCRCLAVRLGSVTALVVEVSEEWVTGRRYLDMEELGEHRGLEELVVETDQPRTQARAFHVARFVWEIEAAYGRRPSWPEMCKLWNDSPMTRPFENWRDFPGSTSCGARRPRCHGTKEPTKR